MGLRGADRISALAPVETVDQILANAPAVECAPAIVLASSNAQAADREKVNARTSGIVPVPAIAQSVDRVGRRADREHDPGSLNVPATVRETGPAQSLGPAKASVPSSAIAQAPVPVMDVPVMDVPVMDVPVMDVPVMDVPVMDVPVMDVPVMDGPVMDGRVMDGRVMDGRVMDGREVAGRGIVPHHGRTAGMTTITGFDHGHHGIARIGTVPTGTAPVGDGEIPTGDITGLTMASILITTAGITVPGAGTGEAAGTLRLSGAGLAGDSVRTPPAGDTTITTRIMLSPLQLT